MKKRVITFLITIVYIFSFAFSVYADPIPLGDIDFDGEITASDARLALRASVALEELDEWQYIAADADKDGHISASDARLILRVSVGLEIFEDNSHFTPEPDLENISAKEMNILLDFLTFSLENQTNAITCLTQYIKTNDNDYVYYFYQFIDLAFSGAYEASNIALHYADTQNVATDMLNTIQILENIQNNSYTPLELGDLLTNSSELTKNALIQCKNIVLNHI